MGETSRPGSGCSLAIMLLGAVALALTGCQQVDSRITVQEFLALEAAGEAGVEAPPATQPAVPEPLTPTAYRVGSGDILTITITGLETIGLPGTYTVRVNEQGRTLLPTIGEVEVAGLTLAEVESKLHKAYVPRYIKETQVTAQIAESALGTPLYQPIDVVVMGEVRTPTTVALRRDKASALQAILAAGGPTDYASGRVVVIPARNPDSPAVFDMSSRADIVRAARPGTVQASDVVVVERRRNDFVYVQGLVNVPGAVPVAPGAKLSVLQAIAASGGPLLAFSPKEGTLIRRRPNGELIRVRLDLQRMVAGEDPDLALAPGDVVSVPHTDATRLEEFLAKSFIFRFGTDTTFNPWTHYYFKKDRETRNDNGGAFNTFGQSLLSTPITIAPAAP